MYSVYVLLCDSSSISFKIYICNTIIMKITMRFIFVTLFVKTFDKIVAITLVVLFHKSQIDFMTHKETNLFDSCSDKVTLKQSHAQSVHGLIQINGRYDIHNPIRYGAILFPNHTKQYYLNRKSHIMM